MPSQPGSMTAQAVCVGFLPVLGEEIVHAKLDNRKQQWLQQSGPSPSLQREACGKTSARHTPLPYLFMFAPRHDKEAVAAVQRVLRGCSPGIDAMAAENKQVKGVGKCGAQPRLSTWKW